MAVTVHGAWNGHFFSLAAEGCLGDIVLLFLYTFLRLSILTS